MSYDFNYQSTALTNDPNGIFEDQTTAGAGTLSLDGVLVSSGVAVAGEASLVGIGGAGDNTGVNFTVTGFDSNGAVVSDTFAGVNNSTASSLISFKTVSGITVDGAITGNVSGGWSSLNPGYGKAYRVNANQGDFKVMLAVKVTGTINYTAQYTPDSPTDTYANSWAVDADWRSVDGLAALAVDDESNIAFPVHGVRLSINSGTGTAKFKSRQGY